MAETEPPGAAGALEVGLRPFLEQVDDIGELERVSGAHWDIEMAAISDELCKSDRDPKPALLFDDIPDYPSGHRALFGGTNSANRLALALGMDPVYDHPIDFVRDYRDYAASLHDGELLDPEFVGADDVPVLEHIQRGDEVDVFSLPVPMAHDLDGGRYIGTADCFVTRDAETGQYNVGTYRMQAHDAAEVGVSIVPGHHGDDHLKSYHARDEPAPVVALFGMDPTLWTFSSFGLQHTHPFAEFAYAGGLKGTPMPVVEGPVTGLPIPATAEVAIEGYVAPDRTATEGPFGETFGYYASDPRPAPVVDVEALYHRDDPILTCAIPGRPPYDYSMHKSLSRSANLWNQIEAAGLPGVAGVWRTEEGGARLFNVVSVDTRYAGHAKQVGHVAAHTQGGGQANRWTVVVDDDVDPSDLSQVVWAMGTRCDPATDIDLAPGGWGSPVDPLAEDKANPTSTRAIVDATVPFERREDFPPVVDYEPAYREELREKWADILSAGG